MSIKVKTIRSENRVYINRKLVGKLRNFCCGVDFRPINKNCVFSILRLKLNKNNNIDEKLKHCLNCLSSIKIPNNCFHWNFKYETAINKKLLEEYEHKLNKAYNEL